MSVKTDLKSSETKKAEFQAMSNHGGKIKFAFLVFKKTSNSIFPPWLLMAWNSAFLVSLLFSGGIHAKLRKNKL